MRDPMKFKEFKLLELNDDQLLIIERELFEQLQIVRGEITRRRLRNKPVALQSDVKVEVVKRRRSNKVSFVEVVDDDVTVGDIEAVIEGMKMILEENKK